MEKFSAYRDPGTGIQPFLTPVPPSGSNVLATLLLPFKYAIAAVRTLLVLVLLAVYTVDVLGICAILHPIAPIHRVVTGLLTSLLTRSALFIIGLTWIPVERVSRKRGRGKPVANAWYPKAGDVIVSNWVSWIELLWLACRYNPIFVLPVFDPLTVTTPTPGRDGIVTHTPGRRTGTGSANIASTRQASPQGTFRGFRVSSLLEMILLTGRVPPYDSAATTPCMKFDDIQKQADRPIVVFPESTTSNGRGLLRFSNVFPKEQVPTKKFGVFIMCVRYDPPTDFTPTLSCPIPSSFNPLGHLFALTTSLTPLSISIRLLEPADSISSQLFMVSEVVPDAANEDVFVSSCAALIAQLGKMKRTGLGWEDKASFFEFYRARKY
ncbi:hypothetical protein PC9H_005108 [Pleurotus ostreatus]|uniref:Phospholipid/glycerol acyltransferase domain-containing protein n=1 Tax=Pleurotus ostreatus TaxID=5322 RepID=A0A8H6ZZA2_PLEOS|nr:uncharacterized protein PC9H_005108 [Pleurotus ostreatus]KAF7433159.1 hypothetical protein PC9H_005108 [Pleurotus ostreatus]KAJ8698202.1 hypothetical protein PTI98_004940 [Pleurotus ostreatus]